MQLNSSHTHEASSGANFSQHHHAPTPVPVPSLVSSIPFTSPHHSISSTSSPPLANSIFLWSTTLSFPYHTIPLILSIFLPPQAPSLASLSCVHPAATLLISGAHTHSCLFSSHFLLLFLLVLLEFFHCFLLSIFSFSPPLVIFVYFILLHFPYVSPRYKYYKLVISQSLFPFTISCHSFISFIFIFN